VGVGVVLADIVRVLAVGLLRREIFQPFLEVGVEAALVVVDKDGGG
jgi:hypothetical protein